MSPITTLRYALCHGELPEGLPAPRSQERESWGPGPSLEVGVWGTHVLEAPVEALQLLLGELGLRLQLVKPLRLVAHRGQLQLAVAAIWRGTQTQEGGTCGPAPISLQCGCQAPGASRGGETLLVRLPRTAAQAVHCTNGPGCSLTAHSVVPPGLSAALLLTQNGPSLLGSPGARPPSQPCGGMGWEVGVSLVLERKKAETSYRAPRPLRPNSWTTSSMQPSPISPGSVKGTPLAHHTAAWLHFASGLDSHLSRKSHFKFSVCRAGTRSFI